MNQTTTSYHPVFTSAVVPQTSLSNPLMISVTVPPGFVWSSTLIVVVAVASYLALSVIVCVTYRCARQHGMKALTCPNPCLTTCCSSCPKCSCLNDCATDYNSGAWWKRPVPSLDSLFDQCCPKKTLTPACFSCSGLNCGKWPFCKSQQPNCNDSWFKGCPPTCCKNLLEDACCGYGGGNCRFLCLECKVRARTQTGATADVVAGTPIPGATINSPYPMYPGMPYNYGNQLPPGISSTFVPNQPYYWTAQPNVPPNVLSSPPTAQMPASTLPVNPFQFPSISSNVSPVITYPPNLIPSWIPPRSVLPT